MQEFANVYEHKILPKDLKRAIKKQIQNGRGIIPYTNDSLQRMQRYLQTNRYTRPEWNYQGNWQFNVGCVETGKPKIQLVPYDVQLRGLDALVRDLVTGTEYRAPRLHAYFGAYDDPTSELYEQGDAIAVIAQVAEEGGMQTSLGSTYVEEKILEPLLTDIKGKPIFIPQWLVPLTVDVTLRLTWKVQPATVEEIQKRIAADYPYMNSCSHAYKLIFEDMCAQEKRYRRDPFLEANLKLSGGVVCDGFFGRVLENYVTDIKHRVQDFGVDKEDIE
ncbi:hypothetical protein HY772_04060 [Candidatus Woesearchaeota archaeon]|nr:hypothetical protein [Candidatus Woesearchaeota archaeon]